jgi:hypothetical protein
MKLKKTMMLFIIQSASVNVVFFNLLVVVTLVVFGKINVNIRHRNAGRNR